ncbi:hypothetical protein DMUE_4379 [Dictyocoela muelleri]|nr:hypothetical protein DMUE_4379 [Dictyocoela muelleri]
MLSKDESVPTYENSKFENYNEINLESFKDINHDSPKQGRIFNDTSENTAENKKLGDHLPEEFKVKKEEVSDNNSLDNDLPPFNDSNDHDSELENLSNKDDLSNRKNTNIEISQVKDSPNKENKGNVYESGPLDYVKDLKSGVENISKSSCPEEIIDINQDFNIFNYSNPKFGITSKEVKYENTSKDHEKAKASSKNKKNFRSKGDLNDDFKEKE